MVRSAGAPHQAQFLPASPVHPSAWHSGAPGAAAPGAPPGQDPSPGFHNPCPGSGHLFPYSSAPAAGAREHGWPPQTLDPTGPGGDALATLRARVAGSLPSRLGQGCWRGAEQGLDAGLAQGSGQGLVRHSSAASGAAGGERSPGSADSSAAASSPLASPREHQPLRTFPVLGEREQLQGPTQGFGLEELGASYPSQGFDSQQLGALMRLAAGAPEYPGQGSGSQQLQSPDQGYAQPAELLAEQFEQLNRLVHLALATQQGPGQGSAGSDGDGAPHALPGGSQHQLGAGPAGWLGPQGAPQPGWGALGQGAAPHWGGFAPWPGAAPGVGQGAGVPPQAGYGPRVAVPPQAGFGMGPGPSGWQ